MCYCKRILYTFILPGVVAISFPNAVQSPSVASITSCFLTAINGTKECPLSCQRHAFTAENAIDIRLNKHSFNSVIYN